MAQPNGAWVPGELDADRHWLLAAIDLSRQSPPSSAAFSVGALLVAASGEVIATGYSREADPADHAEEIALRRAAGIELGAATLYSSLEPCLRRASRPDSCAALISAAGVRRVVIAWREPPLFVPGGGATWLTTHGIAVKVLPELAAAAKAVNQHLLSG
jgi:diaminohydroxyphosphoribosylaminopyrimidine deaminase/5-amino-6-(5-phosphoribosylamino)uracil reductase